MKLREYILYAKKTKITTLFNNLSLRHHSAILENIHWTQTAYAVLCQPRYGDAEETNCWIKSLLFSLRTKSTLSYFSVPWQCYLLSSQWDSHKPPGFHPKYLKLCSEDEQRFTGLERHRGKWLMTKSSFWGGVTL